MRAAVTGVGRARSVKKHSTHSAHARTDTRAYANVAGRSAAAAIGLKINARPSPPPVRPTRTAGGPAPRPPTRSSVRPYNYFRFISPSRAHRHRLRRALHLCDAPLSRLQTKLYRPSDLPLYRTSSSSASIGTDQ